MEWYWSSVAQKWVNNDTGDTRTPEDMQVLLCDLLQRAFDELSDPHADEAWRQELLGDIDKALR